MDIADVLVTYAFFRGLTDPTEGSLKQRYALYYYAKRTPSSFRLVLKDPSRHTKSYFYCQLGSLIWSNLILSNLLSAYLAICYMS